ncbi:MAG TPA: large-conductance mechanosensitive channel protein MscL [Planctomycetaceae bacterium]|nr:large-conductance mechanosensitive channel protein MscL [Planctomycetaceae bacterium]
MGIISEFKQFVQRGNVIDLAVGVIMGAAFGKIVNSLVTDVLMPPIGFLVGGVKFTDLKFALPANPLNPKLEPATINYGNFLQTTFDFLIIAFCIFMLIQAMNKMKKKQDAGAAPPPEPTTQEKLLMEIRDLLKVKSP